METWRHPSLGKFTADEIAWKGHCTLPSFKAFRFGGSRRSKLRLEFEIVDEPIVPVKRAIAVAERIVKNEQSLSTRIANAVWKDLNGKGKNTGMWWHGDIEGVLENVERAGGKPKIETAKDMFKILGSPSVWIRESIYLYEKPCGIICFNPAFDTEHGLGVLTNGTSVLGLGYQMSVSPYLTC